MKPGRTTFNYALRGTLTIKGIEKNICLNLAFGGIHNDHEGSQKAGFSLTVRLIRSNWGIACNKVIATGGLLVGEEIIISCEIVLIKAGQFAQAMVLDGSRGGAAIYGS